MTFDNTKDPPVQDHAADFAEKFALAEPVKIEGAPEVVPVTVEQLPRPPKAAPAPDKMVHCERIHDDNGKIVGLNVTPLAGHALVRLELRGLLNGRYQVSLFTEPRRGRTPRSSKPKSRKEH